jgi:hypothetical protein
MSATRYSGRTTVNVKLDDKFVPGGRQGYACTVSCGKSRTKFGVTTPITMAVDSPKAFDEVAMSAITFALDDKTIDDDDVDWTDSGVKIRRKK